MRRVSDTVYALLSGECCFDITAELSEEESLKIARERLRLPRIFSIGRNWENTTKTLDRMPARWECAKLLRGELLLLLDEKFETELMGEKLKYSKNNGLEMIKSCCEISCAI